MLRPNQILILLSIAFFAFCFSAEAYTVYVDVHNLNPNPDGTITNPFTSITIALGTTADTIMVNPGIYDETVLIDHNVTISGTDATDISRVMVRRMAPEDAVIVVSGAATIQNLTVLLNSTGITRVDDDGNAITDQESPGNAFNVLDTASLTLSNVDASGYEAGVYCHKATFSISQGQIHGNSFGIVADTCSSSTVQSSSINTNSQVGVLYTTMPTITSTAFYGNGVDYRSI